MASKIYKKLDFLGKGGFGEVFKVLDLENDTIYAKKVIEIIRRSKQDNFTQAIKRARDEITLQKSLNHKNIIRIIDNYEEQPDNATYILTIIMEYTEFGDLSKLMKDLEEVGKWFSEYKILDLMIQICRGVEQIHHGNITHLDLKPGNILVFDEDTLKIPDFGISKHLSSVTDYMTASKWTQSYAAPELLNGDRFHLEPDIWAVGCIFYKLCTTKLPYNSKELTDIHEIVKMKEISTVLALPRNPSKSSSKENLSMVNVNQVQIELKHNDQYTITDNLSNNEDTLSKNKVNFNSKSHFFHRYWKVWLFGLILLVSLIMNITVIILYIKNSTKSTQEFEDNNYTNKDKFEKTIIKFQIENQILSTKIQYLYKTFYDLNYMGKIYKLKLENTTQNNKMQYLVHKIADINEEIEVEYENENEEEYEIV